MKPRDSGFTLVEVLAAVVLASVLSVIAVGGFGRLARSQEQQGTVNELTSALRNAQVRAVSEARTYCLQINAAAGTYRLRRGTLTPTTTSCSQQIAGSYRVQGASTLSGVTFATVDGLPTVFFTARGTATSGQVKVSRPSSARISTITVEGLTSRVSSN